MIRPEGMDIEKHIGSFWPLLFIRDKLDFLRSAIPNPLTESARPVSRAGFQGGVREPTWVLDQSASPQGTGESHPSYLLSVWSCKPFLGPGEMIQAFLRLVKAKYALK